MISHHVLSECLLCVALAFHGSGGDDQGNQAQPPESGTLQRLKDLELSSDQLRRVTELVSKYEPLIAEAERRARLTEAQRAARQEAIQQAIAEGKRGADAVEQISRSVRLTEDQRAAQRSVARLHNEFSQQLDGLLTEDQTADIELGTENVLPESLVLRVDVQEFEDTGEITNLLEFAQRAKLADLEEKLLEYGIQSTHRAVDPKYLELIGPEHEQLVKRLRSYWRIDLGATDHKAQDVSESLRSLEEVDSVYIERPLGSPSFPAGVDPTDDTFCSRQGYLDPAPLGINAHYAWRCPHGTGTGVGLVDLERKWNLDHEEFRDIPPLLVYGENRGGDHGTGVLGAIVAQDNSTGIVGIAPSPSYVMLASWHRVPVPDSHIANAVAAVVPLMNPGDVLLLEVENMPSKLPVETVDINFDAIQLAVAHGIIVVECAGNGEHDLDEFRDSAGRQVLNRSSPDFRDSGAIIVGAANPYSRHDRSTFSCYGTRVDCFAWGNRITTCGGGNLDDGGGDPDRTYRTNFGGTSGAAPIIAGAAMILQGMAQANRGRTISPDCMRAILSDPRLGTPQGTTVTGRIGVMPDLKRILERCPEDFLPP